VQDAKSVENILEEIINGEFPQGRAYRAFPSCPRPADGRGEGGVVGQGRDVLGNGGDHVLGR
jgi:hypothetical protein